MFGIIFVNKVVVFVVGVLVVVVVEVVVVLFGLVLENPLLLIMRPGNQKFIKINR